MENPITSSNAVIPSASLIRRCWTVTLSWIVTNGNADAIVLGELETP